MPALAMAVMLSGARSRHAIARWRRLQPPEAVAALGYPVTGLGPEVPLGALLVPVRAHWAIENRLHRVRDATTGEDARRVRTGAAPQVLAGLRNAALGLMQRAGVGNVAADLRHNAWRPGAVRRLLGLIP